MNSDLSWQERANKINKSRLGDVYPHSSTALTFFDLPSWEAPEHDRETYAVDIRTEGGHYGQFIELRKHDGQWSHFYVVKNYASNDPIARISAYQAYIDPQFPVLQDPSSVEAFVGRTVNTCADQLEKVPLLPNGEDIFHQQPTPTPEPKTSAATAP